MLSLVLILEPTHFVGSQARVIFPGGFRDDFAVDSIANTITSAGPS